MTTPLGPDGIEIDRSSEREWFSLINAEISKPWGPNERVRTVNVGKEAWRGLGVWLATQYEKCGWSCSWRYDVGPEPSSILFYRPAPTKSSSPVPPSAQ